MSAQGAFKITEQFEQAICDYTGAPYCVAVDNCSNALFLALKYWSEHFLPPQKYPTWLVEIPSHTYPAVAAEIIHVGGHIWFNDSSEYLTGAYEIKNSNVWDSALRFTGDMYLPNSFMCLSFTGPYKHLKLGKGGAILTDNEDAYKWFKKARFSGRSECSYHEDNFDENPVIGWNFYMPPQIAALGLHLMTGFYNPDGSKKVMPDLSIKYPDLSKFNLWK